MAFPLEEVRKRPGMYIGTAQSVEGLTQVFIDFAIDAFLTGNGSTILVDLLPEGGIRVISNARSLPMAYTDDMPANIRNLFLHQIPEERDPTFDPPYLLPSSVDLGDDYRVTGGRSANIFWVLNAVSRTVIVEIRQEGQCFQQKFQDQQPVNNGVATTREGGTKTIVTFFPDPTVYRNAHIQWPRLYQYLRQSTYLVQGLTARLTDWRQSPARVLGFPAARDVAQWVLDLTAGHWPCTGVIIINGEEERTRVQIALQYTRADRTILSFVNNVQTKRGGGPVAGFLDAVREAWSSIGELDPNPYSEVTSGGSVHLIAVVSIWMPNPLFKNLNVSELYNPEVRNQVFKVARKGLLPYFEANHDRLLRVKALKARQAP